MFILIRVCFTMNIYLYNILTDFKKATLDDFIYYKFVHLCNKIIVGYYKLYQINTFI